MILMSNNQWKCDKNRDAWLERGEDCSAEARVGGLVRAYTSVMPDVLGLQEVSVRMAELMMARLSRVEAADGGVARYAYISGGDTPIVYRADRLKLLESGFYLYDEHIDGLEGSFNNSETKSYCFGVFEQRTTGSRFALMSTHLWWKSSNPAAGSYQPHSDEARAHQLGLASARMDELYAKYHCPCVIMGDFNAVMGSPCLKRAQAEGWAEAYDLCVGERDETRGHHPCGPNGYSRGDAGLFSGAIDHIILKNAPGAVVNSLRRIRDEWFDSISDHYPLYIDITMG